MNGKALLASVIAVICTSGLAACSSDDSSSSSSTTSAKQAVCADRDNLEQSVNSLKDLSVATEGKSGVESAVNKVKKNLDDLGSSAKQAYQPDVDAVKSALDQLQSAVNDFGNQSVTQSVQDIGDAISKVGSTTSTLANDVKASCPS